MDEKDCQWILLVQGWIVLVVANRLRNEIFV